ncbi:hypothetical protein [Polyangium aurulentum]|uniref:hypothetical protein n=1 Tax=Polyangium aurulentum TaxID=2567896 RepID=UPI0010AE31AB|nr:hypothetical protein [Polyangium aurulentum]UQA60600.1 hypothetical protein E8A73_009050 [Polyangium aurulentum]
MHKNNGWMSKTFAMVLLSAGGALLAGCYVDNGAEEEEVIDEVESAFTESTCGTTATPDDSLTAAIDCYDYEDSVSPGASYGEALCTAGWLVTASGTYDSAAMAKAYPANTDDINTQAECENTVTKIRRLSSTGSLIESKSWYGRWNGTDCVWEDTSGQQSYIGIATGNRLVVQAARESTGALLRVRLAVTGPAC